jgi:hypothetical protein
VSASCTLAYLLIDTSIVLQAAGEKSWDLYISGTDTWFVDNFATSFGGAVFVESPVLNSQLAPLVVCATTLDTLDCATVTQASMSYA